MNRITLNILIVEDDVHFRNSLGELLRRACPVHRIVLAANVRQGRQYLDGKHHFDVVILDFRLPTESGGQDIDTTLCQLARQHLRNSFVIHVTAYQDHPVAKEHIREVHSPWIGPGPRMETQHLGIAIRKGPARNADPKDPKEASKWAFEIVEAVTHRAQLLSIEEGLCCVLGDDGSGRSMGRMAVPDAGLTGHLAGLSLAVESAWPWLPGSTRERVRQLFTVKEVEGASHEVHVQML